MAPLESYKEVKKVFLPEGTWYEFFSGDQNEGDRTFFHECGIKQLPIYIKGSSIITMYPDVGRNTADIGDILELHVYNGSESYETTYYEDDGRSFEYEKGDYHKRILQFSPESNLISLSEAIGSYASQMKKLRILFHGFDISKASVNGESVNIEKMNYEFIEPTSNFDPVDPFIEGYDDGHPRNYDLMFIVTAYKAGKMDVSFD